MEAERKQLMSQTEKENIMTHFCNMDFTCSYKDGMEKPLCLICNETLFVESMKPSKLKRLINTKHTESSDKPIQFERLSESSKKQKKTTENFYTVNERYMRASYEASYLIAKPTKPFSVGENFVLSAAVKMSEIVHGKKYGEDICQIPLSMTLLPQELLKLVTTNMSN